MISSRSGIAAATAAVTAGTVNSTAVSDIWTLRLVWKQANHQAVGFAEHRAVGRCHSSLYENLAAVDVADRGAGLQRLVDRGDLAVVDVQERGPGRPDVRGGDGHPEQPVVEQRNHAAVHGAVAADVRLGE